MSSVRSTLFTGKLWGSGVMGSTVESTDSKKVRGERFEIGGNYKVLSVE
jgi:hypothetical protein